MLVMKRMFFLSCLGFSLLAQAQMKEGRIIYERVIQLRARMIAGDPAAAQLPKTRTDHFELLFGNGQSLWQFLPTASNEDPGTFSGNGVVLRFGGTNDIIYHNYEKGVRVDQREIMDRSFVITDTIARPQWKLTDETKTILNHVARKALGHRVIMRMQLTMENGEMKRQTIPDTSEVIAWFTTDIAVPTGPETQGQLPGAILELDINKGQTVYTATEISSKVNLSKINEPNDGKKVSAAEFTKEREKLMEEMKKNMPNGGDGNRVRIVN
jgi:GLPGLI family protein